MTAALKNVRLGDILDIRDGTHDTPKYVEHGIPLITSKNLTDNGLCFRNISYISEGDHKEISKRSAVGRGDILYGMIGTIGKPTLVETDIQFSIKNVALFKLSNPEVDNRYFLYLLKSDEINKQISQASKGGTQKFVSLGALRDLKATLPSLPEQRRIAAILDKANALRAKRREAIAKLDQLLLSVFLEMFGDPVTNPKGWDIVTLSALSSEKMANGIFRKKEGYSDTGLPVVWIEELFRGHELDLSKSRKLQPTEKDLRTYGLLPGDILFCRSSLNLDGIAYNNIYLGESDRALFECHLIRLRVNQSLVDPVFLNYLLRNEGVRGQIKQRAKTSTMTTIDQKGLNDVAVILPSRELQAKFRSILESVALRTALMESCMLTGETLFKSLQHQVFSRNL